MIPKIIHQTYHKKQLPDDLQRWNKKAMELHSDWEFHLWNDEENRDIVKEHFPEMLGAYDSLPYNIMRVDIIRYMYMYLFGGVYMDLDYELLKPLDKIIIGEKLILPLSREKNLKTYKHGAVIGNCIFASEPGHIFWKDVLDKFSQDPPIEVFSNKSKIVHLTGPDFITGVYFQNPERYSALLPERHLFHPDLSFARRQYNTLVERNECFGIHHCKGSWLKNNNSVFNQVARAKNWMERRMRKLLFL